MSSPQWLFVLVLLFTSSQGNAALLRHMDLFIRAVEHVEAQNPGLGPLDIVKVLRQVGGYDSTVAQHFLGMLRDMKMEVSALDTEFYDFISKDITHRVTEAGEEEGVVLAHDGTTVALEPLLLGIEVGLSAKTDSQHSGLYTVTLAQDLGLSFLAFHHTVIPRRLGPNGCWNSISAPEIFILAGTPSLATEALLNGGVDGAVLGTELSASTHQPLTLSGLLTQYYGLGRGGPDTAPRLVSVRRRDNFRELVTPALLQQEVLNALQVHWELMGDAPVADVETIVSEGIQDFIQSFTNCPAIIPRCMWGASPYKGTPTQLARPLSYLYIHHTYEPSQPCLTFEQCAADMRAMQQFHQDGNGWDDIGYSFVAGSDGNLYEGRGWLWQGAHTSGYNSKGYGVAIIGDFTSSLPSQRTLELVRDQLATCAVSSGHLVPNYVVHGHRQLVNTFCPGDALYKQIQAWPHFKEVEA